jgi:pyruvate carboxylase
MTQMLLRASNAVGYTNYPDNVVRSFVLQAHVGVDVFRVFDSLNWVPNMRVAMDGVVEADKVCEAAICYTGRRARREPAQVRHKYYVAMARELETRAPMSWGSRTWGA